MLSAGYYRPSDLSTVLDSLQSYSDKAKILAGGTDLLLAGRQGQMRDKYLIDITGIKELKQVKEDGSNLYLGSLATHTDIAANPLVKQYAKLLAEAVESIGSPQIRNRGTIGGNIANASPAADSVPALVALGSKVTLRSAFGERVLPVQDFLSCAYKTQMKPEELIVNVIVPKLSGKSRSKFIKVGRRNSLAISRVSMAGIAEQEEDGRVNFVRLVPGAVFPVPTIIEEANNVLAGKRPSAKDIKEVAQRVAEKTVEITGIRWSTPYKKPVCSNLCHLILHEILRGVD